MIEIYGQKYLRKPTHNDILQLQAHHTSVHGFPRIIGNLYCLYWACENCPTTHYVQFTQGDHGNTTIILEAVVSHDQ